MKKKKRPIIILVSIFAFVLCGIGVYAAFVFTKNVSGTAATGEINVVSQNFLDYSMTQGDYQEATNKNEYIAKARIKKAYTKVDLTSETFVSNKYYTLTTESVPKATLSTAIGKETGTVSAIPSAYTTSYKDYIYVSFDSLTTLYSDNHILQKAQDASKATVYTVNLDFATYYKVTASMASSFDSSKTYYTKDVSTKQATTSRFKAYATERSGRTEDDWRYPYLSQLGFEFTFTNTIDVYIRVHFEDAWLSTKTYSNNYTETKYITKDKLDDKSSPFQISESGWYYDSGTNCSYYTSVISGSKSKELRSYSFDLDSSYFYIVNSTRNYREAILVEVSYYVDIVQANRAKAIWGIDPSTLA